MSDTETIFTVPVSLGVSKMNSTCHEATIPRERLETPTLVPDVNNKDGDWFCPFVFSGTKRLDAEAVSSKLLVFDVDDVTREVMLKVLKKINALGLEKVLYTTTKHTLANPRYRLILRSDHSISPEDYRRVLPVVAEAFGLPFDASSRKPTQLMFLAMVGEDRQDDFKFVHTPGEALPIQRFLEHETNGGEGEGEDAGYTGAPTTLNPLPAPDGVPHEVWLAAIAECVPIKGCGYEGWVEMGQALWHQTFGDEIGFAIWEAWSKADTEKFENNSSSGNDMRTKWPTFEPEDGRRCVTIRTILNKKVGPMRVEALVVSKLIEATATTVELEQMRKHVTEQRYIKQTEVEGPISKAYKDKLKELTDSTITQAQALRELAIAPEVRSAGENSYFYDNFVWLITDRAYYHLEEATAYDVMSFNLKYTKLFAPMNRAGMRTDMHTILKNQDDFQTPRFVSGMRYFPQHPNQLVEEDGKLWINMFDQKNWPKYEEAFGEHFADADVENVINKLLLILSDGRPEVAKYLRQYLAHLRQKPGVRILHAYSLISLIGGVGKSSWETIHKCVLGGANIGSINYEILSEQYTEWVGAQRLMTFVQELQGGTPHQMTKALAKVKEPITNTHGPIRIKGKKAEIVPFYTSYCVLSNMEHALGDEATSRRFLPIHIEAPLTTQNKVPEVLTTIIGEDSVDFFTMLNEIANQHPERYAAYFDTVDIEDFDVFNIQISTSEKAAAEDENILAKVTQMIHEFIEENQDPSNMNAHGVYFASVVKKMQFESDIDGDEKFIGTRFMRDQIRNALKILGYKQLDTANKKVRVAFGSCALPRANAIWIHKTSNLASLRAELAKLPTNHSDEE